METKKEQAREVSCSVRVQTDDHSGTNTVHAHAVEMSSRTCNPTPGMWPKSAVRSKKREEKRESVEDGQARRVCLLFRPSSINFSCISWTKMFTEKQESVNFEVFVCWAVIFHFFPTLLKHEKFDLPLWNFVALSSASFNVMPLWSCSQPMDQPSLWSANFEWRKSVFEELDPERWTLIFPAPKDEYHVRHKVRKRGGEESKTIW